MLFIVPSSVIIIQMKIISWNVNGLRATHKQGYFLPFMASEKPDILCLQETKAEPEQLEEEARNPAGYFSYFSHSKGRKGYSGVAIYSKIEPEKVEYGMGIPKFDDYDAFLKFIDKLKKQGKSIIFCGDVNTAHETIDLARPKENEENTGFLPEERTWIDEVISSGYTDVFRHLY